MWRLIIPLMALALLANACGGGSDQIDSLIHPTMQATFTLRAEETRIPTATHAPTETPVPGKTPTPRIEGLFEPGMYLVGTAAAKSPLAFTRARESPVTGNALAD